MVQQNTTEAEFDTKRGEISLFSRHVFNKKGYKVVGTVSILLVQHEDGNCGESDSDNRLSLPSSLSIVSLPHFRQPPNQCFNSFSTEPYHRNQSGADFQNERFYETAEYNKSTSDKFDRLHQEEIRSNCHNDSQNNLNNLKFREQTTGKVSVIDFTACADDISNKRKRTFSSVISDADNTVKMVPEVENTDSWQHAAAPLQVNSPKDNHATSRQSFTSQRLNSSSTDLPKGKLFRQRHAIARMNRRSRSKLHGDTQCPNKCSVCGEVLVTCEGVIHHSEIHSMPLKCVICGLVLSSKNNLKRHAACHVSNVLYTCYKCSAMFRRKDNLKKHITMHESGNVGLKRKTLGRFSMMKNLFKKKINRFDLHAVEKKINEKHTQRESEADRAMSGVSGRDALPTGADDTICTRDALQGQRPLGPGVELEVPCDLITDIKNLDKGALRTITDENIKLKTMNLPKTFDIDVNSSNSNNHIAINPSNSNIPYFLLNQEKINDEEKNAIMHYSCNTCGTQFQNLEDLKKHAITVHSEQRCFLDDNIASNHRAVSNFTEESPPNSLPTEYSNLSVPKGKSSTNKSQIDLAGESGQISVAQNRLVTEVSPDTCHKTVGSNVPSSVDTNATDSLVDKTIGSSSSLSNATNVAGNWTKRPVFSLSTTAGYPNDEVIDIEKLGELSSNSVKSEKIDSFESLDTIDVKLEAEDTTEQWNNFDISGNSMSGNYFPFYANSYEANDSVMASVSQSLSEMTTTIKLQKKSRLPKERPVCSACGVVFQKWEEILQHGELHQSELMDRFTCIACGTVLSSKDNLRRHAVSHMGISHPCPHCFVKFTRIDNLKKHVKVNHGKIM